MTAVLRELKETEIKDKRADYEARADKGAKCGDLKALAAAGEKFAVIYADPPWEFKVYRGKGKQRSAERYYDTFIEMIWGVAAERKPLETVARPLSSVKD